jgi:hypothetical protein
MAFQNRLLWMRVDPMRMPSSKNQRAQAIPISHADHATPLAPCGMKRTVIPRPAHTATGFSLGGLQGRGIYRRIARGWMR